jgi:hypothetical protein
MRNNVGWLSFAGDFGGVTMILPMRPLLAGHVASVAPGALIVQFKSHAADRFIAARNPAANTQTVDEAWS